jgi:hypothetical protein
MWRGSTYPGSRLQHPSRPFLQWRTAEFEKRRKKQPPDAARRFVPATTSATLPVCLFDWKRCSVLTCLVQVSLHPTIIPTSTSAGHDDNGRQQRAEIRRKQLEDHFTQRACSLCISVAHRLIETIHEHLDTLYTSSGWHSVYCECSYDPQGRSAIYTANHAQSHLPQRPSCWLRPDCPQPRTTR